MRPVSRTSSVIFPLVALCLVLAACNPAPPGPGPQAIGDLYYQAIQSGDFAAAAELYASDVSRQAVIDELASNRERFGELESYRMTDLVSYTASGGLRYTLRYMTRYANGHATEGLMLFQSATDNLVRIEQHTVQ